MTREGVERLVKSITYRPGWVLKAFVSPYKPVWQQEMIFQLTVKVQDRDRPDVLIELMSSKSLPVMELEQLDEDFVREWIFRSIFIDFEIHEAEEWFKIDGVRVHDPHKLPKRG